MKWWYYLIGIVVVVVLWFLFANLIIKDIDTETPKEVQTIKDKISIIEKESGKEFTTEEELWYILDLEYKMSLAEKIDAMIIVKCESQFNPYAINVNRDGSFDLGIWQINERIHKLSRDCMFDIYCSTEYAINQLYAKNKNFSAWVCAK